MIRKLELYNLCAGKLTGDIEVHGTQKNKCVSEIYTVNYTDMGILSLCFLGAL